MTVLLTLLGKTMSLFSRIVGWGHGSTWPGHIALETDKNFIKKILKSSKTKIILIAGTNGKTTTAKLIQTILEAKELKVFRNISGANLLNGIASSLLLNSNAIGKLYADYGIFEIDENSLPLVLKELTPDYLLLLNLFRDQLDRYGEVNTIASKWNSALQKLLSSTTLILNADDPQIAWLGMNSSSQAKRDDLKPQEIASSQAPRNDDKCIFYFGLDDPKLGLSKQEHAVDSTYCPRCQKKLDYKTIYFSHLGNWECKNCKLKRPKLDNSTSPLYPLDGVYNHYNTNAAVLLSKTLNIDSKSLNSALENFKPAFGRQEKLTVDNKQVQLFLSKNPTSFNQSLRTISELGAKNLLIVLNDRIPDGRDVSWIWDVDFEELDQEKINISVSGDRVYDMGLRLKYANSSKIKSEKLKVKNYENLKEAILEALKSTQPNETLYILPTYSAMLETRKILTGKKIL